MMGTKERSFAQLIHVSLEELVPKDYILCVFCSCFMNYEIASSTELSIRKMVSLG